MDLVITEKKQSTQKNLWRDRYRTGTSPLRPFERQSPVHFRAEATHLQATPLLTQVKSGPYNQGPPMRPPLALLLVALTASPSFSQGAPQVGERPAIETHLSQREIESGRIGLRPLLAHGKKLFVSRFNALDGQGRPASTGTGEPRIPDQPNFIRTSSPDANSCADCHTTPDVGGSGGFAVNVFVLAQQFDPVIESISPTLSNERNTVGMMGAGPIEMLAREMS